MGEHIDQLGSRASRRVVLFLGGFAAVTVAAISVAWACTAQMSPLKICKYGSTTECNLAGAGGGDATKVQLVPGSRITATNSGFTPPLKPAAYYHVRFNNANRVANLQSCHSAPYIMLSNVLTSASGYFTVHPYLPSSYTNAPKGVSEVCATESSPVPGATATNHAKMTII